MMNPDMVIKPAYEVRKLPETYVTTRTVYEYVRQKDGPAIRKEKTVTEKGGYLVKTMKNGSFRVRNTHELRMLGLDSRPAMIHVDSGEPIPVNMSQNVVDILNEGDG